MIGIGNWIQYVAQNGQSQFGKVSNLVRDMNSGDVRIVLKLLNGKTDYIWKSGDWVIVRPSQAFLLDEKYNENNKQSNDLQQRKRHDMVNSPSHYTYGEIEVIDFIEQVTQHYNANVAYHIGNAIKYLARSPHKNGKEDVEKAKWYIERAFENWDVK